jgi:hypothetical protein
MERLGMREVRQRVFPAFAVSWARFICNVHKLADYDRSPKCRRPDMGVKRSEHDANHAPLMCFRMCEVSFII